MLRISIDVEKEAVSQRLDRIAQRLVSAGEMHEVIGLEIAEQVREHISDMKDSPNTGWWDRVADSVTHSFSEDSAVVEVPYRGAALRYYGGTVTQKPGGPLLTIPTDDVPVKNKTRLAARDLEPLAFIPNRGGNSATVGFLVEGESYRKTKGPNKGEIGKRPKKGGALMYVLRTETEHQEDQTVLPDRKKMRSAARGAVLDYLSILTEGESV